VPIGIDIVYRPQGPLDDGSGFSLKASIDARGRQAGFQDLLDEGKANPFIKIHLIAVHTNRQAKLIGSRGYRPD